jgi:protein TonB
VTGAGSGSNLRRRIENIMSTNNSTRAAAWYRWLAGTMVGFALVLMVVAGLYSRARNVNAAVHEVNSAANAPSVASMNSTAVADGKGSKANKAQQPPPPPHAPDEIPALPPAPPADSQDAPAPTAPASPAVPATPAAAAPATPPATPVAPAPPTKEKIKSDKVKPDKVKSKDKVKANDAQDKEEKGGIIEAPPPVYPGEAREKKVEGMVTVEIVIGEEGNVIRAKPASGPDLLQGAAKDAALKARFRPTMVNGKPAKVSGTLSYNFVLDK